MSDKPLVSLDDFHKRYVKPAQQELAIDILKAQLAEARELLAAALPFLEILQPDGEDAGPALNELLYGIDRVLGLDDEATAAPPQSGR